MYTDNYQIPVGTTGLALKAALSYADGTIHATARDLTGVVELGAGMYSWTYASHPDGFRGQVVFYTGTLAAAGNFSGVTIKAVADASPEAAGVLPRQRAPNPAEGLSSVVFRLDEREGVSVGSNGYMTGWLDLSDNPLAVTITSPPRVVPDDGGRVIWEFNYSGAGQYVDIAGLSVNRRAFTIAVAFEPHALYPGDSDSTEEVMLGSTSDGLTIWIGSSGATSTIRVNDSGGFGNATAHFPRCKPTNVLVVSGDATQCRIMLNGKTSTEVAMTAGTVTGFRLGGRTPTAAGPWRGRIPDFVVRSVASSWAEMADVSARLHEKHRVGRIVTSVITLTDSIGVGLHPTAVTDRNIVWPSMLVDGRPGWQLRNYGQSGLSAAQAIGASLIQTFAGFSGENEPAGDVQIGVIALGSNDKALSTDNTTLAGYISTLSDQFRTYCGCAAVIAVGVTPRNPFTLADLQDLHAKMRALVGTKLDGFADPLDDPIFATNDSTNAFRFAGDSTHLNADGEAALWRIVQAEVDRVMPRVLGKVYDRIGTRAAPGDAMTLTTGERTAVANEVETQIINEGDPEKVIEAIVNAINAADPNLAGLTVSAIAQGVWDRLTSLANTAGSMGKLVKDMLDATVSSRLAAGSYAAPDNASIVAIKAKTDGLNFNGINVVASFNAIGSDTLTAAFKTNLLDFFNAAGSVYGGAITMGTVGGLLTAGAFNTRMSNAVVLPDPAPDGYGATITGGVTVDFTPVLTEIDRVRRLVQFKQQQPRV